uniref:Uncharacterized protein n=1 Tax=Arundo donax TaxID=35708 RepID=A0A0A8XP67_ARUDO
MSKCKLSFLSLSCKVITPIFPSCSLKTLNASELTAGKPDAMANTSSIAKYNLLVWLAVHCPQVYSSTVKHKKILLSTT